MKSETVAKYLRYGLAAILIGIGGFASLFLIKSIVTLAIVSVVGVGMFYGLPAFASWASAMGTKGILANSKANPIEELIAMYKIKDDAITNAAKSITEFATATRSYKDKLDGFITKRPEKAEAFRKTYSDMVHVLDIQTRKLAESQKALKEFQSIIEEAQDIKAMTDEASKANKFMRKFDQPDIMLQIRERTALDSVMDSLNRVTSELDLAVTLDYTNMKTTERLTLDPNPITLEPVAKKERQYV